MQPLWLETIAFAFGGHPTPAADGYNAHENDGAGHLLRRHREDFVFSAVFSQQTEETRRRLEAEEERWRPPSQFPETGEVAPLRACLQNNIFLPMAVAAHCCNNLSDIVPLCALIQESFMEMACAAIVARWFVSIACRPAAGTAHPSAQVDAHMLRGHAALLSRVHRCHSLTPGCFGPGRVHALCLAQLIWTRTTGHFILAYSLLASLVQRHGLRALPSASGFSRGCTPAHARDSCGLAYPAWLVACAAIPYSVVVSSVCKAIRTVGSAPWLMSILVY